MTADIGRIVMVGIMVCAMMAGSAVAAPESTSPAAPSDDTTAGQAADPVPSQSQCAYGPTVNPGGDEWEEVGRNFVCVRTGGDSSDAEVFVFGESSPAGSPDNILPGDTNGEAEAIAVVLADAPPLSDNQYSRNDRMAVVALILEYDDDDGGYYQDQRSEFDNRVYVYSEERSPDGQRVVFPDEVRYEGENKVEYQQVNTGEITTTSNSDVSITFRKADAYGQTITYIDEITFEQSANGASVTLSCDPSGYCSPE